MVCGIRFTPNSAPSTSFTVSDVPASATEPLGAMKRASSVGARKRNRVLSPSGVIATISATPSTWPETICPPISSPSLSARSRLIRSPTLQARRPRRIAVFETLSAETSTSNQAPPPEAAPRSTTVRHTPSQAIEAPMAMVPGSAAQRMRTRRSPRSSRRSTVPISVTIPVNIARLSVLLASARLLARTRRRSKGASGRAPRRPVPSVWLHG